MIELFGFSGADLRRGGAYLRPVRTLRNESLSDPESEALFEFAGNRNLVYSTTKTRPSTFGVIDWQSKKWAAQTYSLPEPFHPVATCRDGKMLASVAEDRSVVEVSQATEKGSRQRFRTGFVAVLVARFSPDAKTLAVGTATGGVQVWDLQTARRLYAQDFGPTFITALTFFEGGRGLAVGSGLGGTGKVILLENTAGRWSVRDEKTFLKPPLDVIDLLVAPDNSKLVVIAGGEGRSLVFSLIHVPGEVVSCL
jgi:hypothetical protein